MMMLSIILIVLSLGVGIGVWLYIRKQDNSSILDEGSKNVKKEKPNSIFDIAHSKLSINDMSNNTITLENYKKRVVLLKIKNSDFNMLSEEAQNVTEDILRQLSVSLQYDIGFYSTTRTVNTSKSLEIPRQTLNTTSNICIQKYAINYIKEFESITTKGRIAEREDYIILTYTGDMSLSIKELGRRSSMFVNTLKKVNTKCEIVSTDNIIELIYHDLNRNDFFSPSSAMKLGALDLYVGHDKKKGA